jgi:hypothetical protein
MESAALLQLELQNDEKDAGFVQLIKKLRIETKEMSEDQKMKHMQSLVQEFSRELSPWRGGSRSWVSAGFSTSLLIIILQEMTSTYGSGSELSLQSWKPFVTRRLSFPTMVMALWPCLVLARKRKGKSFLLRVGNTLLDWIQTLQFALFVQETMSKMLVLVDVIFSKPLLIHGPPDTSPSLLTQISVHGALSKALSGFRLQFHPPPSAQVEKIEKEMLSLLSAKQGKASEAIWSACITEGD